MTKSELDAKLEKSYEQARSRKGRPMNEVFDAIERKEKILKTSMDVTRVLMSEVNTELTEEELREIEALDERPIVFDEDSPEMTDEMLEQFHGFQTTPTNNPEVKIIHLDNRGRG